MKEVPRECPLRDFCVRVINNSAEQYPIGGTDGFIADFGHNAHNSSLLTSACESRNGPYCALSVESLDRLYRDLGIEQESLDDLLS